MTGKVLDGNPTIFLILILPLAAGIVLLYKAWFMLLAFLGIVLIWKFWDNYQWQQWCLRVDPTFNQLLNENQGCLTPMDLSVKAHLTGRSATRFLERKAEEYGAFRKKIQDKGTIYYFITASTLGSIFDDSEPLAEAEDVETLTEDTRSQISLTEPESEESLPKSANVFAQLAGLKEEQQTESEIVQTPSVTEEVTDIHSSEENLAQKPETVEETSVTESQSDLSLIQADLARRLDISSSTIGRRKSDPDFIQWSQSKDPEGMAWKYDPKNNVFVPADIP